MRKVPGSIILLVFCLAGTSVTLAKSASLFSDVPASARAHALARAPEPEVLRSREVALNLDALGAPSQAARTEARLVELNLFADSSFAANLKASSIRPDGATWTGDLNGWPGSRVTLVVSDGVMAGRVDLPGSQFHIRYLGNGIHAVEEIQSSTFPDERNDTILADTGSPANAPAVRRLGYSNGGVAPTNIDILFLYTVEAGQTYGDYSGIKSLALLSTQLTNQAFYDSGVNIYTRVTGIAATGYSEATASFSYAQALTDLQSGVVSGSLSSIRTQTGADVVILLTADISSCGLSYLITDPTGTTARNYAYAVVRGTCATDNDSEGHELGHLLGIAHNDPFAGATPPPLPNRGWAVDNFGRDIMSTQCPNSACPRFGIFSSPNLTVQGVTMGNTKLADAVTGMNARAPYIAGFTTSNGGGSMNGDLPIDHDIPIDHDMPIDHDDPIDH